ncbi:hypothetical protein BT63DRAFT_449441 [Microthyrium microscopicum]|uniref:Zn(2)-C6 fungal-type domain-containing protein n=1 Tax=Microthyrium microscopicum TaxID=703497 RepID=A0A6A6URR9_9PEZI|nr:hypothetical protein BT63DRAFT_449441 [Microthyrium microscopicum]
MTPTPSSTTSSSNHNSPNEQFRVVRRRNRVPLSCGPCRQRKLKCDRSQPCDNCRKRGDLDSCAYATPVARKKNSLSSTSSNTPDEMQNRIDRLEGLVLSLMTNGPTAAGPAAAVAAIAQTSSMPASSVSGSSSEFPVDTDDTIHEEMDEGEDMTDVDVDKLSKNIGVMKVDSGKNIFISEAHWYSILAEISEVKNYFNDNKKSFEDLGKKISANKEGSSSTTGLFFLNAGPATKGEILRSFPSKGTTDVLIARFFEVYNFDPSFQIVHGPTYQKQYDRHWAAPQESEAIWLGLTYAMMMVALVSYQRNGDEPPDYRGRTEDMFRDYKRLSAQCMVLVDLYSPANLLLETAVLYIVAELGKSKDAEMGTMLGITTIVRLAMKMGYHRDPRYFPSITPFAGEMRRRVWALIKHADLRISSQFGMPPIIRSDVTNTETPKNLYDDELSEDLKELPPSRPLQEATPISYIIYKAQVTDIGYQIIEETQKLNDSSYEVVMDLDRELRRVHEAIPPHLKMRAVDESIRDPPNAILKRYIMEIMYLKFICLLHRKYSGCPRYPFSKRTCVESAMEILAYQATIFTEQRPGGRLADAKFFVTSLTSHDFLLAAMIVSVDLHRAAETERSGRSPTDVYDANTRANKIAALEQSLRMWDSVKEESMEAFKAVAALTAMLTLLREQDSKLRNKLQPYAAQAFASNSATPEDSKLAPEHSAAMTLGLLSSGQPLGTPANTFSPNPYDLSSTSASMAPQQFMTTGIADNIPTNAAAPFTNLFGAAGNFPALDIPQNLDWDAWDSYIQGGNPMDPTMAATMWPMNLDPAMDPSASSPSSPNAQATSGAGSLPPNGSMTQPLTGFGAVFNANTVSEQARNGLM